MQTPLATFRRLKQPQRHPNLNPSAMNQNLLNPARLLSTFSLMVALVGVTPSAARADKPFHKCCRCGVECQTSKVCRPVEETKKVAKTQFECKCEDFCVPGKSNLCGVEQGCDECGNVTCTRIWEPTCAQVRSKCVLKKSTVEEEVKVIKWVVEEICPACAGDCHSVEHIPQPAMPGPTGPTTRTSQAKPWLVESQPITAAEERMAQLPYFAPAAETNQFSHRR